MFHNIPVFTLARMRVLEQHDQQDRQDGTPHLQRLRQIPTETGRFLALLAAAAPPGQLLEVGTSGGYSALWLSLACRQRGDRLTTFEILPEKVALARETFRVAEVEPLVELRQADARQALSAYNQVAFCFLDAEKDIYTSCYETIIPRLVNGGLLVADNVISHAQDLQPFLDRALSDPRLDALVVPIGKGLLVGRKVGA